MHKFTRNLLTEWRKLNLPFENETVLAAVSGGADSVALALALSDLQNARKLKLNFIVAHFNHGLRGADAGADAEFVEQLARKIGFEFVGGNWDTALQDKKENLEQSARKARYDFLLKAAEEKNACAVLTAHTVNDQAETLLLNLMRGSGLEGLGAMRKSRKLNSVNCKQQSAKFDESEIRNPKSEINLVRPLLGWANRDATEDFARQKQGGFRRDSMNDDERFSRVKVRKKLIPLLEEFNPKIVKSLAQTAFLLQADAERSADDNYQAENLPVKDLRNLSKTELYFGLRRWLKNVRGSLRQIELSHIEAVERLIFSRKSGRKIELPKGAAIFKKAGKLFFEKSKVEKSRSDN